MADIIESCPNGMDKAVVFFNQLPEDLFAEMCQDVMKVLQYKLGQVDTKVYVTKINAAGGSAEEKSVQSAINAVTYIYRSAARGSVNSENLAKQLTNSSLFKPNSVKILKETWEQEGRSLSLSEVSQLLNVGQLINMKWKLGMAVSSDSCRNLNVPFVTMTVVIAEPSGKQTTKTVEMSVTEFQKFSNQMKEMASILETV